MYLMSYWLFVPEAWHLYQIIQNSIVRLFLVILSWIGFTLLFYFSKTISFMQKKSINRLYSTTFNSQIVHSYKHIYLQNIRYLVCFKYNIFWALAVKHLTFCFENTHAILLDILQVYFSIMNIFWKYIKYINYIIKRYSTTYVQYRNAEPTITNKNEIPSRKASRFVISKNFQKWI